MRTQCFVLRPDLAGWNDVMARLRRKDSHRLGILATPIRGRNGKAEKAKPTEEIMGQITSIDNHA